MITLSQTYKDTNFKRIGASVISLLTFFVAVLSSCSPIAKRTSDEKAAYDLAKRIVPGYVDGIRFCQTEDTLDVFELSFDLALSSMPVACCSKKKPRLFSRGFVFALPIFPGSHPPSIVGVHELNFCVRDGNRWTLMTINTNYIDGFNHHLSSSAEAVEFFGDPYRIRTDVNGVRGRCLNHLTNGPWCTFRDSNPGPTD